MRVEGLEPPNLTALDPKSSVSTNFTTPALQKNCKYKMIGGIMRELKKYLEDFHINKKATKLDFV